MLRYRQALMRMRQVDSDRDIARSGLMCRANAAALRALAQAQGWLNPDATPPGSTGPRLRSGSNHALE